MPKLRGSLTWVSRWGDGRQDVPDSAILTASVERPETRYTSVFVKLESEPKIDHTKFCFVCSAEFR